MNRITIKEPCHENWAAMTPTEKGAFCGKCKIDVVDFSGKSPEEVKLILQQNAGKHLCGRFEKTQFDDLNASYFEWENQSVKIFQSKFLYACLIVFGMTLFSCNTPEDMILGEVSMEYYEPTESSATTVENSDSIITTNTTTHTSDNVQDDEWKHLKGKVDYSYYQEQQTNQQVVAEDTVEIRHIKGEIAYIPEPETIAGDTIIYPTGSEEEIGPTVCHTTTPHVLSKVNNTANEGSSELVLQTGQFTARVFPNPTSTVSTLSLEILSDGVYLIEVYTINGEKILEIYSGELVKGTSNHRIDLSGFDAGTYIVSVSANGQAGTYKILRVD